MNWKFKMISLSGSLNKWVFSPFVQCFLLHFNGLIFGYHNSSFYLYWHVMLISLQLLREQYDELVPALCNNHPDVFPEEFYSWEQFLWACELWYTNSLKIKFTDGNLRTCLVPIAGFLNHSVCFCSSLPESWFPSSHTTNFPLEFGWGVEFLWVILKILPPCLVYGYLLPQIDFFMSL